MRKTAREAEEEHEDPDRVLREEEEAEDFENERASKKKNGKGRGKGGRGRGRGRGSKKEQEAARDCNTHDDEEQPAKEKSSTDGASKKRQGQEAANSATLAKPSSPKMARSRSKSNLQRPKSKCSYPANTIKRLSLQEAETHSSRQQGRQKEPACRSLDFNDPACANSAPSLKRPRTSATRKGDDAPTPAGKDGTPSEKVKRVLDENMKKKIVAC